MTHDPLIAAAEAGLHTYATSQAMLATCVAGGLVVQAVVAGDPALTGARLTRDGEFAIGPDGQRWRWATCADAGAVIGDVDADITGFAAAVAVAVAAAQADRVATLHDAVSLWRAASRAGGSRDLPDPAAAARAVAGALAAALGDPNLGGADVAAAIIDDDMVRLLGVSQPSVTVPSPHGIVERARQTGRVQVVSELTTSAHQTIVCAPFDSPDGPGVVDVRMRVRRGVFAHEVALVREAAEVLADCLWGMRLGGGDRLGQATAMWLRSLAGDEIVDEEALVRLAASALCPAYGADAVWLSSLVPTGRRLLLAWRPPIDAGGVREFAVEGRTVAESTPFGDVRIVGRTSPLRTGEEQPLDAAGLRSYAVVGVGDGVVFGLAARAPDHFAGLQPATLADVGAQVSMVVGRLRARVWAQVANERAARATALNRRLLTAIGHQFRTPLTSIAGFARTLSDPDASATVDDADRREFLSIIVRQAVRLGRLVENFLVFADLDAGTWQPIREPVDIDAVVDAVVRDLRASGESDVDVALDCQAGTVLADLVSMRSVVANLIDNAVRFGRVGVAFSTRVDGSDVVLTAVDHGPGIPAAQRYAVMRLFEEASGDVNPTMGMGFAVIGEFCDRLGGTLELADTEGGGLTVTVRLPVGARSTA